MCSALMLYLLFFACAAPCLTVFFFFNDTATTEIYTLSLHTLFRSRAAGDPRGEARGSGSARHRGCLPVRIRSEEHTSELQSLAYLVCRLLLEKKKSRRTRSSPTYRSSVSRRVPPSSKARPHAPSRP